MRLSEDVYRTYVQILKEELVPAFGCTEPISLAYCAAKAREVLETLPDRVEIHASGNIIKNVKSVIVPNTDGLKGIPAAAAAGIVGGNTAKKLEVIADVTSEQKRAMREYLERVPIEVKPLENGEKLDILVKVYAEGHSAEVRISRTHCNIAYIRRDGEMIYHEDAPASEGKSTKADRSLLTIENIVRFAEDMDIADVKEVLDRQISYNYAIALEGMQNDWGANIGSTLVKTYGDDVKVKAKAYAAAGSDARMSGCEMPVIINSGSGNQGMTASLPVIVYAKEYHKSQEELYRALIVSNLCTIHQKTGIGRLSAYCGAVSAGIGAGCGIAYLLGGDYEALCHTMVNGLAIVSGIICDGAKPSCAGKIAASVDAGILGYYMYKNGCEFKDGEGLVLKGVENTIRNIGQLSREGMKETDKEIIKLMCR